MPTPTPVQVTSITITEEALYVFRRDQLPAALLAKLDGDYPDYEALQDWFTNLHNPYAAASHAETSDRNFTIKTNLG